MAKREPDWDAIAEQEIEARRIQQFNCSDPPEESCSDAGCPVHGDGGDPDWGDDNDIIKDAASLADWDIIAEGGGDG
jgi:hypothetical protein